jgi:peptide/nickel transport system substrate-binding protein
VTLPKPDRLALANLCVPYAIMVNSKLAKQHATPDDPWAMDWMKTNAAASGAYVVESYHPGESVILRRNEAWKGGPDGQLPNFKRIIVQTVPEPATRANLIEKGDADLSIDLAAADITTMMKAPKVKVVSMPQTNGFTHISMNNQMKPFDNVKVRQAIAAALPYQDMFKAALFERGFPLFGADWTGMPPNASFPQPMPLKTDPAKAKALLAEAGYPDGKGLEQFADAFKLSYVTEKEATLGPIANVIGTALRAVGLPVTLDPIPQTQYGDRQVVKKDLAFAINDQEKPIGVDTGYAMQLFFVSKAAGGLNNMENYANPEIDTMWAHAQIDPDPASRDKTLAEMQAILMRDVAWLPVVEFKTQWGITDRLQGLAWFPDNDPRFVDLHY